MNKNLFKGSLQTIILKLLEKEGKMYGYQLSKKATEISDGKVTITEGALYTTLHRMEADDIIESEILEVAGRKRKYYKLTSRGKKEVVNKTDELLAFIQNMNVFLKMN
ncbi:MAG: PadR family transcriptional regulator [Flavobacteriales bacterium]|jgi:DNA-binding PadR family transcriptional regulator|nr:PadR family transcriptional regulator [Flavobacteriales bacterium]